MRLIDKIALNRLLSIIASFILGVIKILSPKSVEEIDTPKPDKKWRPKWRRKQDE
jgi:hypothetical protein